MMRNTDMWSCSSFLLLLMLAFELQKGEILIRNKTNCGASKCSLSYNLLMKINK